MKKALLLLIGLCALQAMAATEKYRVMFNTDPAHAATVGWNQIIGTDVRVYFDTIDYGTDIASYSNSMAPSRTAIYKGMTNTFARLTNLEANTAYYFVIADSEGISDRYWFKTAPDVNTERLSFIAGGDSRNNRVPRQNANRIVSKLHPHAVLFGGDMTNGDTDIEWDEWFEDWKFTFTADNRITPIVAARGNHEQSNFSISELFDTNPEVYFAVNFGGDLIRAYTLNTEISVAGDQTDWLAADLAANPDIIWKSAQYHKPMRPHQSGKSEGNDQYNNWAQLFFENNVRLVVECDAHVVKTTWPVVPDVNGDQGFIRDDENGTVYIGEGCWGAPTRSNNDDKSWTRASESFNQVKWIFVDQTRIEARTIKVDNAESVGNADENDIFTAPENLDIWVPANGTDPVVIIEKPTNPIVSITSPIDGYFIGSPQEINIEAEGYDINGTIDSVAFFANGEKIGTDITSPWQINFTPNNKGVFALSAIAYDNEGKTGTSSAIELRVGNYSADVTLGIVAADDDMEEGADGTIFTGETQIELGTSISNGDQTVGLRFQNVVIPQFAHITKAHIQFTASSVSIANGTLSIEAEATNNAPAFTTENEDISTRNRSIASVDWSPDAWLTDRASDEAQQTPDLANILQEMVNRKSWSLSNAMAFIITGDGTKSIVAFEDDAAAAAQLFVEYTYEAIAPESEVNFPSNDAVIHGLDPITIQANASDADGSVNCVEFLVNGSSIGKDHTADYTMEWTPEAPGSYTVQVIAQDNQLTLDTSEIVVFYVNLLPSVSLISPMNNAQFGEPEETEISVSASDANDAVNSVAYYINGELIHTRYFQPFSFDWDIPKGGDYTIMAVATDMYNGSDSSEVHHINVNNKPVALDDEVTLNENQSVNIAVQDNDSDADGDQLIARVINAPNHGLATVLPNGAIRYEPNADYEGIDVFTYEICDAHVCSSARVRITVVGVNQAPIAENDHATTLEDQAIIIDVKSNDFDPDGDPLNTKIKTQPAHGSATLLSNGSIRYLPSTNYYGTDLFLYETCDAIECKTASISVTIKSVNDAPIAFDDEASTLEEQSVIIPVLGNDQDPEGNNLITSIVSEPRNGQATIMSNGSINYTPNTNFYGIEVFEYQLCDAQDCDVAKVTITVNPLNDIPIAVNDYMNTLEDNSVSIFPLTNDSDADGDAMQIYVMDQAQNGLVTVNGSGTVIYTPNSNFSGQDAITYYACDEVTCGTATIFITVNAVNDLPIAANDLVTLDEDKSINIQAMENDVDTDGDALILEIVTTPLNGTAIVLADGSIQYNPNKNYSGADVITYKVCDAEACSNAEINISINAINDQPITQNDFAEINEDEPLNIDVMANDTDVDGDILSLRLLSNGNNGSATVLSNGNIQYIPNANYHGSETIQYQVCDSYSCTNATLQIQIDAVNDLPIAANDMVSIDEDKSILLDILSNDSDVDGDALEITIHTPSSNGILDLQSNGVLVYTPNANFFGMDVFSYTACDPFGCSNSATVNIMVNAINDAPVAVDDYLSLTEDHSKSISLLTNDNDADGDQLTIRISYGPEHGTATLSVNGDLEYTPFPNYVGSDVIIYEICDAEACSSATINIDIVNENDAPIANTDNVITDEDTEIRITVQANDFDTDGDALTTAIVNQALNGSVSVQLDGSIVYSPDYNFYGSDYFDYEVCDATLCASARVNITVSAVNDLPEGYISNPLANTTHVINQSIALEIEGTDDGEIVSVEYYINGSSVGTGTTEGSLDYSWTPNIPGAYIAVAKITDDEGASIVTDPVSFEVPENIGLLENSIHVEVLIYPNPAQEYIILKNAKASQEIRIVSIDGKLALQQVLQQDNQKIILDHLADGSYYISILEQGHVLQQIPLLKM